MSELSHRSKNLLAVIQAMAKRTARSALSLDNFQSAFGDRLRAMAISHDLLVSQNWACVSLRLLILRQFELFGTLRSAQLHYHGPEVSIEPAAAQSIGLALHELTTNSIKYGALSRPSGKVTVSWGFKGDERNRLWLCWRESGGPPVEPPKREGFGHVVIRDMIAYSLEGEVSIDFAPSGLTWTAIFPSSVIVANGPTIEQGASARANA
jgi:two-component sensor histidine kinase